MENKPPEEVSDRQIYKPSIPGLSNIGKKEYIQHKSHWIKTPNPVVPEKAQSALHQCSDTSYRNRLSRLEHMFNDSPEGTLMPYRQNLASCSDSHSEMHQKKPLMDRVSGQFGWNNPKVMEKPTDSFEKGFIKNLESHKYHQHPSMSNATKTNVQTCLGKMDPDCSGLTSQKEPDQEKPNSLWNELKGNSRDTSAAEPCAQQQKGSDFAMPKKKPTGLDHSFQNIEPGEIRVEDKFWPDRGNSGQECPLAKTKHHKLSEYSGLSLCRKMLPQPKLGADIVQPDCNNELLKSEDSHIKHQTAQKLSDVQTMLSQDNTKNSNFGMNHGPCVQDGIQSRHSRSIFDDSCEAHTFRDYELRPLDRNNQAKSIYEGPSGANSRYSSYEDYEAKVQREGLARPLNSSRENSYFNIAKKKLAGNKKFSSNSPEEPRRDIVVSNLGKKNADLASPLKEYIGSPVNKACAQANISKRSKHKPYRMKARNSGKKSSCANATTSVMES
ncbi:unnamed protein product [Moneuplotes crassus]|uniref:Uncharacterized protein n=1 Tax=Euplotes crassus TaxID=5936 RepID=A0AAD1U7G1_EUPCR|nr:unnamed protein product [Moneuplotes crassus]